MIVQLNIQNNIAVPVIINSDSATGQPIGPNQSLQATFEVQENRQTGVAELHLYIDPAR